jgi:hypothetical protein
MPLQLGNKCSIDRKLHSEADKFLLFIIRIGSLRISDMKINWILAKAAAVFKQTPWKKSVSRFMHGA